MGYMHINNLYKDQDILMFKECYALEKVHGTSAHIRYEPESIHYSGDALIDDGRGGRVKVIGNFSTQYEAVKYAAGKGNWGGDAHVSYQELVICDTAADVEAYDKQILKATALAKLTKDEQEALGLT